MRAAYIRVSSSSLGTPETFGSAKPAVTRMCLVTPNHTGHSGGHTGGLGDETIIWCRIHCSPVIIIDAGPMREKMARNATSARGWPRVDNSQSSTASTRGSVGWKMRLSILKSPWTIPAQQAIGNSEPCTSQCYLSIP